jgi:hypothetical protein
MKALSLFGDTIPVPVTAHAGRCTASGQAVAKEHRTARRGGLDLMTAAALAETPRRDTAVAKPDKAPAGPEPHEELKAYAEAHGISDLAWVTVPVGDPNFPSRERLAAMGRDALEFALARVRTKVARERIQAALHLIDKREKAPAARGVERRSSRRRGPARKEPDFGLAVAPEVPGMPPYMRAAVDWPRLHGSRVRLEVNTEDLELRVPAVVSVEEPKSYGAQLVTCGFRHGCGLRDWAYVDGRLHPILREVRPQPNFKILPHGSPPRSPSSQTAPTSSPTLARLGPRTLPMAPAARCPGGTPSRRSWAVWSRWVCGYIGGPAASSCAPHPSSWWNGPWRTGAWC